MSMMKQTTRKSSGGKREREDEVGGVGANESDRVVPTLAALSTLIKDTDEKFLNAYLETAATMSHCDLVFEKFAAVGANYYKKVKVLSQDPVFVRDITDEQKVAMESDITATAAEIITIRLFGS